MVVMNNVTIRDDRQFRALMGVSPSLFSQLLGKFRIVRRKKQAEAYRTGRRTGTRQRKPGGGAKGRLATDRQKLKFILYYYKNYPTFDVLGAHFNLSRSKAHANVYKLSPLLHDTLAEMGMVPHRHFDSVDDFKLALDGVDLIIIDATERAYRRAIDDATQRAYYSGKQRLHTVKNMVISTPHKFILFLGQTFTGNNHDYKILKTELPPGLEWFSDIKVFIDLGYLGIQSHYPGDDIHIPHKKPRKSKNNPNPELTQLQKEENRAISKVRIFVENAIAGIKRYNILVHRFRNRTPKFDDSVIAVAAGLWNLSLA